MIAQQPINLKTSKNWVLPPRPKPGRKHKPSTKQQQQQQQQSTTTNSGSSCMISDLFVDYNNIPSLSNNLKLIDQENLELKSHLLSLIKEYKSLKSSIFDQQQQQSQQQVSQPTSPYSYSIEQSPSFNSTTTTTTTNITTSSSTNSTTTNTTTTTNNNTNITCLNTATTTPITHKRSYYEIEMEEYLNFNHFSDDDDDHDDNYNDNDNDNDNDHDEEIFSELSRSTTTSTTSDLLYNSK